MMMDWAIDTACLLLSINVSCCGWVGHSSLKYCYAIIIIIIIIMQFLMRHMSVKVWRNRSRNLLFGDCAFAAAGPCLGTICQFTFASLKEHCNDASLMVKNQVRVWKSKKMRFKWQRKVCIDDNEMAASGRQLQTWAAAAGKARLPTVECLCSVPRARACGWIGTVFRSGFSRAN